MRRREFDDDPYLVLDVPRDASLDTIKRAYRELAHKYHPDKTAARFRKLKEAYELLTDADARAEIDRHYAYKKYSDLTSDSQRASEDRKTQQGTATAPSPHSTHHARESRAEAKTTGGRAPSPADAAGVSTVPVKILVLVLLIAIMAVAFFMVTIGLDHRRVPVEGDTDAALVTRYELTETQQPVIEPEPQPPEPVIPARPNSIALFVREGQTEYPSTVRVTNARVVSGHVVLSVEIENTSTDFLSYIVFDRDPLSGDSDTYVIVDANNRQYSLTGVDQPHEDMGVPFLPAFTSMSVIQIAPGAVRQFRVSFHAPSASGPITLFHKHSGGSGGDIFIKGTSVVLPDFQISQIPLEVD